MQKVGADHSHLPPGFSREGSLQHPAQCRLPRGVSWGQTCPLASWETSNKTTPLVTDWKSLRIGKRSLGLGCRGAAPAGGRAHSLPPGDCVPPASVACGSFICREKRMCPVRIQAFLPGKRLLAYKKKNKIKGIEIKMSKRFGNESACFFCGMPWPLTSSMS